MIANKPVIIKGIADDWDPVKLWTEEYLIKNIGHKKVLLTQYSYFHSIT